jgi:hypothetical protein
MNANAYLRDIPGDIVSMISAKMPRLADVQALCALAGRPNLVMPILMERLRTGSWELRENSCFKCNLSRTLHGQECGMCAHLAAPPSEDSRSDFFPSDNESDSD